MKGGLLDERALGRTITSSTLVTSIERICHGLNNGRRIKGGGTVGVAETRKKSVFRLKEFFHDKVFILGHLSLRTDIPV